LEGVPAEIPVLLAIGHDNAQFAGVTLDELFPTVHGAAVEHHDSGQALSRLHRPTIHNGMSPPSL
jgi:hypothetical protein